MNTCRRSLWRGVKDEETSREYGPRCDICCSVVTVGKMQCSLFTYMSGGVIFGLKWRARIHISVIIINTTLQTCHPIPFGQLKHEINIMLLDL